VIGAFLDQFGPTRSQDNKGGQNAKGRSTAARGEKADARSVTTARDARHGPTIKEDKAAKAASLGKLNAAHASPAALAHASRNSTVGQIAAYKAAVEKGDLDAAAALLAGLANKDISTKAVTELNALLGVTLTEDQAAAVAQQARDQQAGAAPARGGMSANSRGAGKSKAETEQTIAAPARSAALGRVNAAHASTRAFDRAAPNSAVGRMAAYQQALLDNDLDKAAAVLAAASNKSVSTETVRGLNGLLGITLDDKVVTEVASKAQELQQASPRR
jgi:hypothetical protein